MSNPNPIRIIKNTNDITVVYGLGLLGYTLHLFEGKSIPGALYIIAEYDAYFSVELASRHKIRRIENGKNNQQFMISDMENLTVATFRHLLQLSHDVGKKTILDFIKTNFPDALTSHNLLSEIDKLKKELDQANCLNRELNKVVDDIRKALP